jgi:hypothetical protein
MRADIAANIMADLKRENEANVEYNELRNAVIRAAEGEVLAQMASFGLQQAVRALQEWKAKQ